MNYRDICIKFNLPYIIDNSQQKIKNIKTPLSYM